MAMLSTHFYYFSLRTFRLLLFSLFSLIIVTNEQLQVNSTKLLNFLTKDSNKYFDPVGKASGMLNAAFEGQETVKSISENPEQFTNRMRGLVYDANAIATTENPLTSCSCGLCKQGEIGACKNLKDKDVPENEIRTCVPKYTSSDSQICNLPFDDNILTSDTSFKARKAQLNNSGFSLSSNLMAKSNSMMSNLNSRVPLGLFCIYECKPFDAENENGNHWNFVKNKPKDCKAISKRRVDQLAAANLGQVPYDINVCKGDPFKD